ncbi:hypothetical protein TRAPUB_10190 [Trametes pubescens]|uniref:Uncharacterized protein n=1 Tax=Trametes pubescens TaxID=154538 RepID=A0A1M2W076_TRAPU|nr:hypothetical protein TRAPUB_10190 [Trametes pubescens]
MPGRVQIVPTPLLTPYFPKDTDGTDDGLHALLSGEISAIFGGSTPYLQADEDWPRCMTCGHALIPYLQISLSSEKTPQEFRQHVPPFAHEGATLLQVFICAEETDSGSCFEAWVMQVEEGESWLVRKVHVDADATELGAASPAHDEARTKLDEEGQLIPERIISEWTARNPETEHWEVSSSADFDEAFYEAHAPADGLKLLGYGVRGRLAARDARTDRKADVLLTTGKYYYGTSDDGKDQCTAGDEGPHFDWRCLIQLGTRDEDNSVGTARRMCTYDM